MLHLSLNNTCFQSVWLSDKNKAYFLLHVLTKVSLPFPCNWDSRLALLGETFRDQVFVEASANEQTESQSHIFSFFRRRMHGMTFFSPLTTHGLSAKL